METTAQELRNRNLPKWPQMLVTGKSVTPEQAKEIIFRTDNFLMDPSEYSGGNNREFNARYRKRAKLDTLLVKCTTAEGRHYSLPDYEKEDVLHNTLGAVATVYVNNDWASCCFAGGPHGWCSPSGDIYFDDNIGKWPTIAEVESDWCVLAHEFPFLDLHVTLMNGESCEDTVPIINLRVVNGNVTLDEGDVSVHKDHNARINNTAGLGDDFWLADGNYNEYRELGLPSAWYNEFADRVRVAIEHMQ